MKTFFRILGALVFAIAALFMFYSFPFTLAAKIGINPELIDSNIDKLFYAFMVLGCGMIYAILSLFLFKGWKPLKHKTASALGVIMGFIFMAGIYYHIIFQSPW